MQVTTAVTPSTAQSGSIHISTPAADLNCLLSMTAATQVSYSHASGKATLSRGRTQTCQMKGGLGRRCARDNISVLG